MKIAEQLRNSTFNSNSTILERYPPGQPKNRHAQPCSFRQSSHVELQNSPAAGTVSQNHQVYLTDVFGFTLCFQFRLDLTEREQKRKRRFKERESSDTHHSFVPSASLQKNQLSSSSFFGEHMQRCDQSSEWSNARERYREQGKGSYGISATNTIIKEISS